MTLGIGWVDTFARELRDKPKTKPIEWGNDGPIRRVGQVLGRAGDHHNGGRGVPAIQGKTEEGGAPSGGEEGSRDTYEKAGRGKAGLTLRSYHAVLIEEGYVPPPPKEVPLTYAGNNRRLPKGLKLTDDQVISLRKEANSIGFTYPGAATRYNVSRITIWNAVKGITFRHLNLAYPPLM